MVLCCGLVRRHEGRPQTTGFKYFNKTVQEAGDQVSLEIFSWQELITGRETCTMPESYCVLLCRFISLTCLS
jgi:hypothetical protein